MEPPKENTPAPPAPAANPIVRKIQQSVSFAIPQKDLLAMRLLQSTDESRYVINGVHFEIRPDGRVLLIATNGRYIGILQPVVMQDEPVTELVEFTVNYPLVRHLPADIGIMNGNVIVRYDGERQKVSFGSGSDIFMCDEITGLYPKWRQVIPSTPFAPFDISINARYVSTFERVAKLLDSVREPQIVIRGHSVSKESKDQSDLAPYSVFVPGLVDKKFFGVIMPMLQKPEVQHPDWLGEWNPAPAPETKTVVIDKLHEEPPAEAPKPTPIPAGAKSESVYGKIFIGNSDNGFRPIEQPGYSIWIEWGKWYTAKTISPEMFGPHDYEGGTGSCKCGCHMGDSSSSGPCDPFGHCPANPLHRPMPELPHPIIPPSVIITKAQARKERKHVHKRNTRPRQDLDRSRRHRHDKARKNLHVQRRTRRGHDRKSSKPTPTRKAR